MGFSGELITCLFFLLPIIKKGQLDFVFLFWTFISILGCNCLVRHDFHSLASPLQPRRLRLFAVNRPNIRCYIAFYIFSTLCEYLRRLFFILTSLLRTAVLIYMVYIFPGTFKVHTYACVRFRANFTFFVFICLGSLLVRLWFILFSSFLPFLGYMIFEEIWIWQVQNLIILILFLKIMSNWVYMHANGSCQISQFQHST